MRSRKTERGSSAPAVLFALSLVILVVVTVYIFLARVWPMPPAITRVGDWIDGQYDLTLWITGSVFVMAQLGLAWVVFRYRDQGQKAHFSHGNNVMEVIWTSATFVLFITMGAMAVHAWAQVHFVSPSPNAMKVDVMAEQFTWNFRYAGPDGKFAPSAPREYNDAEGNPFGIVSNTTDTDDIVSPILEVPVGHQIELRIMAKDVIHSFFVRELRIKQDAVPGMIIPIHFTPLKVGIYDILCAQLCGLGHNRMHSTLHVVSEAEFQNWLSQREAENEE